MKRIIQWACGAFGLLIILAGLLAYLTNWHRNASLQIAYPEDLPIWFLLLGACLLTDNLMKIFGKKSVREEIEEKDERNQTLEHMAKSTAYDIMLVLWYAVWLLSVFTGWFGDLSHLFFGLLAVGYVSYQLRLSYLRKTM